MRSGIVVFWFLLIFILERLKPFYRSWKNGIFHTVSNIGVAFVNQLIFRFIFIFLTLHAIRFSGEKGIGVKIFFPAILGSAAVFLLFDLWIYFWHRLNHTIPFLWRFHAAHHTEIAMDSTSAIRFHPVEISISYILRLPVILLLGMGINDLLFYETVLFLSTVFHHSNIDLPEKWDRRIRILIVSPHMHRIHHSKRMGESNSNYTSVFSFWDRIFGSFNLDRAAENIHIGLNGYDAGKFQSFWGIIVTPFIRRGKS